VLMYLGDALIVCCLCVFVDDWFVSGGLPCVLVWLYVCVFLLTLFVAVSLVWVGLGMLFF